MLHVERHTYSTRTELLFIRMPLLTAELVVA